jgi:hypothetical protein
LVCEGVFFRAFLSERALELCASRRRAQLVPHARLCLPMEVGSQSMDVVQERGSHSIDVVQERKSRRPTKIFMSARVQWQSAHCSSCRQCREAMRAEEQLDWMTPLTRACLDNRTACVQELLKSEADLDFCDFDGHTALHAACAFGHQECASMLIKAGATLDMPDHEGATPLDGARMAGTEEGEAIAAMLLEAGAKALPLDWEGREHEVLKVKRERWATR